MSLRRLCGWWWWGDSNCCWSLQLWRQDFRPDAISLLVSGRKSRHHKNQIQHQIQRNLFFKSLQFNRTETFRFIQQEVYTRIISNNFQFLWTCIRSLFLWVISIRRKINQKICSSQMTHKLSREKEERKDMKIQLKWLLLELFITSVLTITYSAATAQRNGIIEMKRLRKRT